MKSPDCQEWKMLAQRAPQRDAGEAFKSFTRQQDNQMAGNPQHSGATGAPEVTPEQGIKLIQKQISKGEELLKKQPHVSKVECEAWERVTGNYLEKAFGIGSPNVTSVMDIIKYDPAPAYGWSSEADRHRIRVLKQQFELMAGLVEVLASTTVVQDGKVPKPVAGQAGHRIFLVHGHDGTALQETARFLEKLGQEVIVLREQPNQGRTIIEKFENYADVGFAVVLLTGDDRGGTSAVTYKAQKPRARQNVVFEMGYFIGKLGRRCVCVLYRPGVEIPSDYSGVLYLELDMKGAWRLELAKELKSAGLDVDMNKAL
jgi:predicted nucleotide-binding protein